MLEQVNLLLPLLEVLLSLLVVKTQLGLFRRVEIYAELFPLLDYLALFYLLVTDFLVVVLFLHDKFGNCLLLGRYFLLYIFLLELKVFYFLVEFVICVFLGVSC